MDLYLGGKRHTSGVESAGINAAITAVLTITLPGDDEVAERIHRHLGRMLISGRIGVDWDIEREISAGRVLPTEIDAFSAAVRPNRFPDDDRSARGIHRHIGRSLDGCAQLVAN